MSILKQKRKLILVLFLLSCIFLSMNFVSAENNTTINDNSIKDNNIGTAGSNNQINNNSFNELNNMINGDLNKTEVILDKDYVYQYDYDVNFTEGIFINRSLTIDGQGHTIDAKFKSRIFLINSSKVILKNIILINGYGQLNAGGALHFDNNSVGYIINSTFINNWALHGGAIGQYENSTLTIVNSSFIKNRGYIGAAIYCHNSSNTIQNSFFINNIPSGMSYGGAISYVWYSNCSIMNSTFINNSAYMDGGALFFSKYCKGVIVNSTFISNKAYNGGAIAFSDGGSNIVNSTFNNNSASNGGAIYFTRGSKNYINNSIFINNSAERGGGIFYFDKTKGIVNNSIFIENTAKYGGGIYYLNESSKSIVINSVFIRNYAENTCAMNCQNARNCTIIRINPILTADSITSFYNDTKYLTITLKDHKNSPINNTSISISINNVVEILKTDSKGQINIPTKNLIPNSYNVLITFNGTDKYENASINSHIIINKANLKLIAKKKTFKAKTKSKKYVVSIKDNFNNAIKELNVKLKVKGKTYKAKSNDNGKAVFKIKKLNKKGNYKCKIIFKGDNTYKGFTKKVTLIVK